MLHLALQYITRYTCSIVLLLVFFLSPVVSAIPYAQANGLTGGATLPMQIVQQAELATSAVANTATAASNSVIAGLNLQDFTKEFALDGLAFSIAKNMVSQMTQSLLNWINSGFQGSPAFITDLNQMLLNALDETAGEFISSLGGIGEFICSPFQLDVQAALAINYAQARSGMPSGPSAPGCKLSDIGNNIENFLGGIAEGGLDDWLTITSNPQNTPYGAYLAAEASLNIRLRNEAGQEIEIASWGDGFMSKKICQAIEGSSAENCTISTPGQVISEALTFQLSTGPRALIEADEINEIIGALINQLTLMAMEGINGLLGMTAGTGFTDYDYDPNGTTSVPYIDAAVAENAAINTDIFDRQIDRAIVIEESFLRLINETEIRANMNQTVLDLIELERAAAPIPSAYDPTLSTTTIMVDGVSRTLGDIVSNADAVNSNDLTRLINELNMYRDEIATNLTTLNSYKLRLESPATDDISDTAGTDLTEQQGIALEFLTDLSAGAFHSQALIEQKRLEWSRIVQ